MGMTRKQWIERRVKETRQWIEMHGEDMTPDGLRKIEIELGKLEKELAQIVNQKERIQ